MTMDIMFPLGVRLSTWAALGAFLVLGVRDRRYWLAGAAWIGGFEVLYQATVTGQELIDNGFHPSVWWAPPVVFGVFALGVGFVVWAARHGARPSLPLLAAALGVWAIWIATGFHVNGHTLTGLDPTAEALNEGAKTLWALAYLVPLMRSSRARAAGVEVSPSPDAVRAADPAPASY
jgi:hypothetical protein